ncbi:Thiol-disulfide oxidoreductase ResA [Botrimarina colliarenosi]|uniref:Thiol-disulfide oxidoreductase ResA n=1 Tax=Botrimarina colliarenosi TaxID=2528001 RepID=A0A5C6A6U8_9BACT|nr:TlpA disulfide reductase family protein [Botrimarina colliarenosi]TWT95239.1 Thiol-disulfide oxidoreductase ResA [Botrimarina colliarenosi]
MHAPALRVAPVVASLFAATLVPACAADPDPMQLLADSAAAVASAESASVDIRVGTLLVRDDKQDDLSANFVYLTAPDGRFDFHSVDEEGAPSKSGYHVAGNGKVVLTALLSRRRHMLESDADGFASFVRSPGASGIGSGLGGLALAFVDPQAADELAANVTSSEFIGEEEVDGEQLLHARYTVSGDLTTDVWYRADGAPLVRRVRPNVIDTPAIQQMGAQYNEFDYQLTFDFTDWNTEAGLAADDLPVTEPANSLLMDSLYQAPERGAHALLGQAAPAFELPTPDGNSVSLGEPAGEGAVLLEFWSTTCPICVQAMPALEKLHQQYADQGLDYYAVNVGEPADDVAAFLEARGLTPTALLDESAEVAEAYDVSAIPLIVLVGSDGRVQVAQEGFDPATGKQLADQIEATLRGDDIAAQQLEKLRQAEAQQITERERLRSLLDG